MQSISCSRVCQTLVYRTLFKRGNVHLATKPSTQVDDNIENARPYLEIPGPKPWPIIGNGWRFLPGIGTIPSDHYMNLMKLMYKTYGPICKITNIPGKRDLVFLYDPRDFETVFRNEGQWPLRPVFDSFPYYRNVTRKDIFQGVGGIVSVNGEKWQDFRSFVNPVLMQTKNANMYTNRIDEVTNSFIELITEILDEKNEVPDNFAKEIKKWSLEASALIALDTRLYCFNRDLNSDSEPHKMIHAADEIFELYFSLDVGFPLWKYFSTPSWKRYVKALDFFTNVCLKHISHAQQNIKRNQNIDELSILQQLLMTDPDPKKAFVMALDMMLSSIDTTANTVACLLYHLARNPEVQQRLYEELREALPQKNSPITPNILNSLKYLKACVRESNRVTPIVVGTGRCLPVDIVLSNYHIPKNTDVLMCNSVITNMEEHFPQADKFKPERWLKSKECVMHKPHPFAMLPFGFGKRNCVGMRFALLELEIFAAKVIRNFKLEWHYDEMRFNSGAVYSPADPLKIRVFSR